MSGDPEQEYFVDGLTRSVITGLSGNPRLLVIAQNSTFTYKGKPVNVQQVARELGVGYVVEGSVQKAKDRSRITVQLINAATGHHLWSEKYDRDLKDILALQDEITAKILLSLEVKLTEGEQGWMRYRGADTPEAFLKASKARAHFLLQTREANALARKQAEEAITLMPENSSLYSLVAAIHLTDLIYGSTKSPIISYAQANRCLKKALALDRENSDAWSTLASLYVMRKQHDIAIAAAERAVALNPNGADAFAILGWILSYSGRPEEGVEFLNKAFRLNPLPPGHYYSMLSFALNLSDRYKEAIAAYKKGLDREPTNPRLHIGLAASYVYLGRQEEAKATAAQVLKLDPEYSLDDHAKTLPLKNEAAKERLVAALRKAGLK
jgi:adenylate cyclase